MAHIRQSSPYSGLVFQVKALETFKVVPYSLGSGRGQGVRGLSACCPPPRSTLKGLGLRVWGSAVIAHKRQSRPYSGLGFQVEVLKNSQAVPYSL